MLSRWIKIKKFVVGFSIFCIICFCQSILAYNPTISKEKTAKHKYNKAIRASNKKVSKKNRKIRKIKSSKISKVTNTDGVSEATKMTNVVANTAAKVATKPAQDTTGATEIVAQPKPVATSAVKPSEFILAPPNFDAKGYILIDANSGYVIAEKNADQRLAPASLTKVMTLYLIADFLHTGRIHLNDTVHISENAWRVGGSRMFIKVGANVPIDTLINGIATASGNDATIAIAEHLTGSESSFANLMNQTARSLGMNNTNFTDSNGLPSDQHYSTARDLAILSSKWISNFPEYYKWFKEKWVFYNGIKQPNRNRLLWRDQTVDGIKTGHTENAGYCLIASAVRNNGMRLISVVLGARTDELRNKYSEELLNYGYRFFETRKLFEANTSIVTPRVWLGKEKIAVLGLKAGIYTTLPVGQSGEVKASAEVSKHLKAPIVKGQSYGVLNITLNDKVIASQPLIALRDNNRCNFIFSLCDYVLMLFQH